MKKKYILNIMTVTVEMIKEENLKILECEEEKSIKKCYYKLALRWHPDRNPNGNENFKKIQNAYDILSNEESLEREYKKRKERDERENKTQRKIKSIIKFLDDNECQYEKEKSLKYYEDLINNLYDKIFYLLEYKWVDNWGYSKGTNKFLFKIIKDKIFMEKENIFCLYNINPCQLNLNNLYRRAFLIHIIEERLYNKKISNNQMVDLFNFLEYSLEETPAWDILL